MLHVATFFMRKSAVESVINWVLHSRVMMLFVDLPRVSQS